MRGYGTLHKLWYLPSELPSPMPRRYLKRLLGIRLDQTSPFFSRTILRKSKRKKKAVKCQWSGCTNDATKVLYRLTDEEERQETSSSNVRRFSWAYSAEFRVCDTHLEVAKFEYPEVANKEP